LAYDASFNPSQVDVDQAILTLDLARKTFSESSQKIQDQIDLDTAQLAYDASFNPSRIDFDKAKLASDLAKLT